MIQKIEPLTTVTIITGHPFLHKITSKACYDMTTGVGLLCYRSHVGLRGSEPRRTIANYVLTYPAVWLHVYIYV